MNKFKLKLKYNINNNVIIKMFKKIILKIDSILIIIFILLIKLIKYINKIIIPLEIVKNIIKENQWLIKYVLKFNDKIILNKIKFDPIDVGWINLLFNANELIIIDKINIIKIK